MSKKIFQDMVRVKRELPQPSSPSPERRGNKPRAGSRYSLWLVALAAIAFLFFALSFLFAKAQIIINPRTKDFTLNQNFSAAKDLGPNGLIFDSVILAGEVSEEIPAGEEKDYLEPAQGKVIIYNATPASQILSIDTRLEGSNGKIYKTKTRTIIPAASQSGLPGKVEVLIYAAEAGEAYNSPPLDFKIVGFKGTPKYTKFYARSVGEITGGLKGVSRQVSKEDQEKAINNLNQALVEKLFQQAKDQIPEDFVLFKEASFTNFDEVKVSPVAENNQATVKVKGTFYGFLFNQKQLTKKITDLLLDEGNKNDDVYIANLTDLKISLNNKSQTLFTDAASITFNLSGSPKIVWKINSDKIIADVLGKNKNDFSQILGKYPTIDSATSAVKPVWKMSFPDKAKKIKIIVNYPIIP
jgi:hypothetical protein